MNAFEHRNSIHSAVQAKYLLSMDLALQKQRQVPTPSALSV